MHTCVAISMTRSSDCPEPLNQDGWVHVTPTSSNSSTKWPGYSSYVHLKWAARGEGPFVSVAP